MSEQHLIKCMMIDGKFIEPCWALDEAIDEKNGKGLHFETLYSFAERLKPTRNGVFLKSGAFKKKGVLLNYCPFCGTNISSQFDANAAGHD